MDNQVIYEMFSGQFDHEIIENVISAYKNNLNDAIEYLLNMQSGSVTDSNIVQSNPHEDKKSQNNSNAERHVKMENDKIVSSKTEISKQNLTVMKNKDAAALVRKYVSNKKKVLVLIRGCPGSGKTTMAKKLRMEGVMLSPEDEISNNSLLDFSTAHFMVEENVEAAMRKSKNPIVIDSMNIKMNDMLPYARLANIFDYSVEVIEADVEWRLKPSMLATKSCHKLTSHYIESLLKEYDHNVTGKDLLTKVKESESKAPKSSDNNCNGSKSESKEYVACCSSSVSINFKSLFSDKKTSTDNSKDLEELKMEYPSMDGKFIKSLFIECGRNPNLVKDVLNDVGKEYLMPLNQFKSEIIAEPASTSNAITQSNKIKEPTEQKLTNPSTEQGNMWTTKIKVKQLEDKFPSIDKSIVKNIFVESGYKMDLAVKTIESALEMLGQSEDTEESSGELEICLLNKLKELKLDQHENVSLLDQNCLDLVQQIADHEKLHEEILSKTRRYFDEKKYCAAHAYSTKIQVIKKKLSEDRKLCREMLVHNMIDCASRFGSIDLHGLTKEEAMDLVSQFFSFYCKEISQISSRSHIFVSTDSVPQSIGDSSLVKASVEDYLKKNSCEFSETGQGVLKVKLNIN